MNKFILCEILKSNVLHLKIQKNGEKIKKKKNFQLEKQLWKGTLPPAPTPTSTPTTYS